MDPEHHVQIDTSTLKWSSVPIPYAMFFPPFVFIIVHREKAKKNQTTMQHF